MRPFSSRTTKLKRARFAIRMAVNCRRWCLRPDGSVVRLDRGGTVVGLLDDMQYEEGAVTLQSGDIVIAYSDGVTEPENEFGDFGEERMVELVYRNRHLPLEEISGHLMQALQDWIGGEEQPDDITIVLARQG